MKWMNNWFKKKVPDVVVEFCKKIEEGNVTITKDGTYFEIKHHESGVSLMYKYNDFKVYAVLGYRNKYIHVDDHWWYIKQYLFGKENKKEQAILDKLRGEK